MNLQPVILCGGSGTRLWPLLREKYPKQLLTLGGNDTLLQETVHRMDGSLAAPRHQLLQLIVVAGDPLRNRSCIYRQNFKQGYATTKKVELAMKSRGADKRGGTSA